MSEKLDKFRKILELSQSNLTKEEFLDAFKNALAIITKMGVNLDTKIKNFEEETKQTMRSNNQAMGGIDAKYTSIVNKIKVDYETDMASVKKEAMEYCMEQMKGMMNGHEKRMLEMERKNNSTALNMPVKVEKEIKKLRSEVLDIIPTIEQIEQDLPKLGEPIRDALELLKGDNRLDKSAIKGLQEELDRILQLAQSKQTFGAGGVIGIRSSKYSLSSQLNGSTRTFTLPAFLKIGHIASSSFPFSAFEPDTDYTVDASAHTITFTNQIELTGALAAGQTLIIELIN